MVKRTTGAQAGQQTVSLAFKKVRIVGGGWNTGFDAPCDDGTIYLRTDTSEPVRLDPGATAWVPLRRIGAGYNFSLAEYATMSGGKTFDIAACPTNNNHVWLIEGGWLYYSGNKGAAWEKVTNFAQQTDLTNGGGTGGFDQRKMGPSMAVDPANGLVCLAGTPTGTYLIIRTAANTFTVTKVPSVPNVYSKDQRALVAFDRTSTVTGSRTQGIVVWIPTAAATGQLWKSSNAGTSWTQDATCPATKAGCLRISRVNGQIWIAGTQVGDGDGEVYRWISGSGWSGSLKTGIKNLALHPTQAGWVIAAQTGSAFYVSKDNGATWPRYRTPIRKSPNDPWLRRPTKGI